MKVVHVVAGELSGGAAKGAYNIHKALRGLGIDSIIITTGKNDYNDPNIISLNVGFSDKVKIVLQRYFDKKKIKKYKNRQNTILSSGLPLFGVDITKFKVVKEADIVNLHWINSGMINIKKLKKIQCKIVWTLRDMWPITGICHYTLGCDGYLTGCGKCFQLNSVNKNDISRKVSFIKKKISKRITTVGVSTWIKKEADRSYIFKDSKNFYIQNCINTEEFMPIEKEIARNIIGLNSDKKIVMLGAQNLQDSYKGGKYLSELLKLLDPNKIQFLIIGKVNPDLVSLLQELHFESKFLGFISDTLALRVIYSAANVFITLSIQDCLPKMPVEAMCCRTPVIAFRTTGLVDIVEDKSNGCLVELGDLHSMRDSLYWILDNNNYDVICESAHNKAISYFDSHIVAKKYKQLYEEILSGN